MEGTNPALENAHKIAQKKGFKGDINSFKTLISTNEGALGDVYNSVRSQGYNKDINSFKALVGIEAPKKKKASTSTSDSQKSVSVPQTGSSVGNQPDIIAKNNEKARSIPKGTKFRLATDEEAQAAADKDILAKRKSGKEGETVVTPFTEQEKKNIGYKPKTISKEKIEALYSLDKDGLIKKAPENEFSKFADFNTSPENKAILKGALQKHDQATTVDETFINEAVAEAEEIAGGNNTWENVKSGVKGAFNTFLGQNIGLTNVATKLGINPYQNTDPLAEEKTKERKRLIDSGVDPKKINEADVLNGAKKIYAENKIKDKKLSLSNDFYDNLDDKEKEALELKFTYDKSKLTDEDNRLIQNLKLTKARIKDLTFDAEPILAKIKNKEQISPEEFKIVENLDKQIILHNDIYNDYQSNSKNLLSAEEELDLVKREYGEVQNFVADVGTAGLKIGLGVLQTAKTALIDYNPTIIAFNELSKLNNGTEEAGGIIDEISSNLDLGLGKAQSELENWNQNTFRKNTENFNSVNDGINFVTDLIGNQAPNIALMIGTGGGSTLATRLGVEGNKLAIGSIGAYSYGNKKNEMIDSNNSDDPNKRTYYSNTQIELASILYGGSEMFETATLGSLGKTKRFIGASLAEAPTRELFRKSIKENIISGLKSNSKDVLEENIEEQVTNLIQNYTERNVLGRNDVGLFDNAGEVLKSSTTMALLLKAPQFAGAVAKKFQPEQYNKILDKNANEVLSLFNELKKEGLTPETKKVIDDRIKKLSQESDAIVKKTFERIGKLPAEQIDKVVELEKSTAELRAKAEAVQNDESLSKETKESLIKDLSSQYKTQEDLRTKIVSEKATILDILPENEVTDLKKKAVETLLTENVGTNEANYTEEKIDAKAIELYNIQNQPVVEQTTTYTKEPVTEVNPVPSVSNEITPTENVSPIENVVSPEVANPIQEENKNVIDNYNNKLAFTRELFSGDENRFNEFVEKSKELEDVNQVDKFIEDNLPKSFNQNEDLIAPLKETIINGINNKQIKQNEATPSQDIADDGNIRPSDAVVDQNGSANKGDKQGGVQQPSNLQGNNGQEIVLDDVANFLNEQFGAEKPVVNPTPSPEVVKEIEPKAVKVEEAPKQTKAQQAKGFVSMATNSLATSLKDFQGRSKEYSEQTYNRIVNEAKEGILNISSIPPIQIWRNPDTGKFTILAGHSRTKAFSDLASGKVEFSDKYQKSDFENINSQIVEAETLEEAQKIAQESNQGAVQTVVDNAKYVRESLLPTFKNFNQAKTKLKSLYGSAWARIYAYANLNPKGKAMQMLKQFQDSNESDSDDKSKRIAEWTGKARNEFENLTDAHENEIFDYLLKNDKVKTYAELSELLNRRVNGLEEFNTNEPLNFEQKVGRGSNEVEIVKQIQDLKSRDAQIKKTIKDLQSFGKNLNDTQRQQIKDLTAESIKINTVDIPNAQKKQKQARAADAEQFDIFSQINEQVENGNITPEQVDEFVNDDRKAEEIEPIVEVIESKAKGYNKAELEEVAAEVDAIVNKPILTDNEKIVRNHKGRVYQNPKDGYYYEVTGYNSGYFTLKDAETGKISKEKEVDFENNFIDVTDEVAKQNAGITSESSAFQNGSNYDITQFEDNVFEVKDSNDKNAPTYKVVVGKAFDLDDSTITKDGKPLRKNEQLPQGALLAIQNHVERFNPESKVREINRFLGREVNKPIPVMEEDNKKATKSKQQLKDKANAEVDKIADKIKGLLPGIKDPNLKNQGFSQDQLIDLIASAVKNLVSAGIDINEAIKQVVDSVKAKFGDIDIDIEAVKERVNPKQKAQQDVNDNGGTFKRKAGKKSLLSRLKKGDNEQSVIDALEKSPLDYTVRNQEEAYNKAVEFVDKNGIVESYNAIKNNLIENMDIKALIYNEILKRMPSEIDAELEGISDIAEYSKAQEELYKEFARISSEFSDFATNLGQGISVLNFIYNQNSNLQYELSKQVEKHKASNNGEISPEVLAKFEEADKKIKELSKKITEAEKKLIDAEEQLAVNNIIEQLARAKNPKSTNTVLPSDKAKALADKLRSLKIGNRPGVFKSTVGADIVWDSAVEITAQAIQATGDITQSIQKGLKAIRESDWYKNLNKNEKAEAEFGFTEFFLDNSEIEKEQEFARYDKKGNLIIPPSLIKKYVAEGFNKIETLTERIIEDLENSGFNPTEREVRDAITGYGKTAGKTRPEIDVEIAKLKSLGKLISKLEDLQNGITKTKSEVKKRNLTQQEKEIKAQIKQLENDLGLNEERRTKAAKTRLKNKIEELKERIAKKDYSKKEVKPIQEDAELRSLRAEKIAQQEIFDKEAYISEINNRNRLEKFRDTLLGVWNIPRILMATGEMSWVLIQGGVQTTSNLITNPKRVIKAIGDMFKAMANTDYANKWENELKSSEFYLVANSSRLALTESDHKLEAREEQFLGDFINVIWDLPGLGLKAMTKNKEYITTKGLIKRLFGKQLNESDYKNLNEQWRNANPMRILERGNTMYMNQMRINRFMDGMQMLQLQGKNHVDNIDEYKKVAAAVNTLTGRANVDKYGLDSKTAAAIFFSFRNWVAKINMMNPYYYASLGNYSSPEQIFTKKPTVAQKIMVTDMIKYMTFTGSMLLLLKAAMGDDEEGNPNATIETDPRSSDFMKLKTGNLRLDPWGGLQSSVTFFTRILLDETKSTKTGEIVKGGTKFGSRTRDQLTIDYVSGKFNPSTSMAWNFFKSSEKEVDGEIKRLDKFGNEVNPFKDAENFTPMYWGAIEDIKKEQPGLWGDFFMVSGALGINSQVYGNRKEDKK